MASKLLFPCIPFRCLSSLARLPVASTPQAHVECSQNGPFSGSPIPVTLPDVARVNAMLQKLKDIGVSEAAVGRLSSTTIPALWKKTRLLLKEGLSPLQVVKLVEHDGTSFVTVSYERLVASLDFLKSLDMTGQKAGDILTKRIMYSRVFFDCDVEILERKVDRFGELGIDRALFMKALISHPSIIAISPQKLEMLVEYLRDLGIDHKGIVKIFSRHPRIFGYSLQETIMPTVSYLESRGLSKDEMCKLFSAYPLCLTKSLKSTIRRLDLLERLGLQSQIFKAYCLLMQFRWELIHARFEWFTNQGFSRADVASMVTHFPAIFKFSEGTLSKKIDYLVKVLKRDVKEIVAFPQFLTYSLEKRIIPRFDVLTKLQEMGILEGQLRLTHVVCMTDKKFIARFTKRLEA